MQLTSWRGQVAYVSAYVRANIRAEKIGDDANHECVFKMVGCTTLVDYKFALPGVGLNKNNGQSMASLSKPEDPLGFTVFTYCSSFL